ncbi:MAG: hypothetical protein ACRCS8_03105 [Brevinema sp.]
MEIFIPLLSLLFFTGLLFYFRHTDARNISVQSLQNFLKDSERRVEAMLRQKEKEFHDKMISSDIAMERMNRLAQMLQEKVKEFDHDMAQGQDILQALRNEIAGIQTELSTYKQISAEFKDAEEKIGTILEMKEQSKEVAKTVQDLRDTVNLFESDYRMFTNSLQEKSRAELASFHDVLQEDLNKYLLNAREQMSNKDNEISVKINELGGASDEIAKRIKEFKEYIEINLETLKDKYDSDLELAKTIAHTNLEDVFDMWNKLKEETQLSKETMEQAIFEKEQFFREAESALLGRIDESVDKVQVMVSDSEAKFEHLIGERTQGVDSHVNDALFQLSQRVETTKERLEQELQDQIENIKAELTRTSTAFMEQESMMEERFKALNTKTTEYLAHEEDKFQDSINSLRDVVNNTNADATNILAEFRSNLEEKINENLELVERNFREANQERLQRSIEEVTHVLEREYRDQFQQTIQEMSLDAERLQQSVAEKQAYVDLLEQRFQEINENFDIEKNKIVQMVQEVERDKDRALSAASESIKLHLQSLSNDLKIMMGDLFDRERAEFQNESSIWKERYEETIGHAREVFNRERTAFHNDSEMWKERYEESLGEARDTFNIIKSEISNVEHLLESVKDSSLSKLRDESERLIQESSRRMDDFKQYSADHIRGCRDDIQHQLTLARQEMTNLKEELWKQEKDVRDIAQKDLDRLSARIKEADKQLASFYKKSEKLDKADELIHSLQKSSNEVTALRKDVDDLMNNLKNSFYEGREVLQNIDASRNTLEVQVQALNLQTEEAERTREHLINSINDVKAVGSVFEQLEAEKDKAKELEDLLLKNLSTFNDLQDSLGLLEQRKDLVDQIMSRIEMTDNGISTLSNSTEALVSKIEEISLFSDQLQGNFASLQSEMKILAGDQNTLQTAVSRFNELDHMIVHIDAEMKRLDKMREWIAKAMNNVEKTGANLGIPRQNQDDGEEEQNIKNILRLHEQKWSVADISKNLKITPAYVELILERYQK